MSTSTDAAVPATGSGQPIRLHLRELSGSAHLDGGWWPRTRYLALELRELVAALPPARGRVTKVLYSPPDWIVHSARVPVGGGHVIVTSFPRDDTHVVLLTMSTRTVLRLLVVPPSLTAAEGVRALEAAADSGNNQAAQILLESVAWQPSASVVRQQRRGAPTRDVVR